MKSAMKTKPKTPPQPQLPSYLSNLQDLLELEELGEPVIWPDGLSAIQAKNLLKQHEEERNLSMANMVPNSDYASSGIDSDEQDGDPTLPQVYSKEDRYIQHSPHAPLARIKRRFVVGNDYTEFKHPRVNNARATSSNDPPLPVLPARTTLDDSDFSLSEPESGTL